MNKIEQKIKGVKPEVVINEQFKQELRRELLVRIEEMKSQQPVKSNKIMNLFNFSKLSYGLVGGVLSLIIVVAGVYYFNQQGILFGSPESGLKSDFEATELADNAFGSLAIESDQAEGAVGIGGVRPQSGGGGDALGVGGGGGGMPGQMITPSVYRYFYQGDDFILDQDEMEVLKRIKGNLVSSITNLIKGIDLGVVNLSKFNDARLETISFTQDKDFGYMVHINFYEGYVSINNTYNGWKQVLGYCLATGCVQPDPIKIDDLPDESEILRIAGDFIKEFDIDVGNYGQPETNRERIITEASRYNPNGYVSEIVSVIYPLVVNGRTVYEEWGNKSGLTVSVNVSVMKATGLYGLTIQNYQASNYPVETDFNKVLKIAERGGIYQYYDNQGKIIEVELDTPESVYMKFWKNNFGDSEELLVPALRFPIKNASDDLYKENVVVPLVKDLLLP